MALFLSDELEVCCGEEKFQITKEQSHGGGREGEGKTEDDPLNKKYYLLKTVINSDHRKRPFDPLLSIADIVMHQLLLLITSIIKERY